MSKELKIKREIIAVINSGSHNGMFKRDIAANLPHVKAALITEILGKLEKDGEITRTHDGKYLLPENSKMKRGTFTKNQAGYGFVAVEGEELSIFIPAKSTAGAMTGDTVLCTITQNSPKGPSGEVRRILEHGRSDFVACLAMEDGHYAVHPMRRDLPYSIPLQQKGAKLPDLGKCQVGDWVHAQLMPRANEHAALKATIISSIGKSNSITNLLNAISKEYGIPEKYAKSTEEHAAALEPLEIKRENCTRLNVFTVDPEDAKDFDDAISLQQQRDGSTIIGVHIADVACYVRAGTPLDRAAQKRCFTTYLPGKTIGMLPCSLSNEHCSLNPGEKRLAHSIFMRVSPEGEVLSSRRAHTIVQSKNRLTFEIVDRVLEGKSEGLSKATLQLIKRAGALTASMRKYRAEHEQFLPYAPMEVRVLCGGTPPKIQGISNSRKIASPASEMIEELMLAANTCVAKELADRQIPGLYRNHAEPEEASLREMNPLIREILEIKPPDLTRRAAFVSFLGKLSESNGSDAIMLALLRCMPRATYGINCQGHYALGKEIYCHFTSPIRRYPDLLVHQQLLALDTAGKLRDEKSVAAIAQACNAREIISDQAEFAVSDRLKIEYALNEFRSKKGSCLECILIKLTTGGMSLYIPKLALMGFMEYDQLPGCYGKYDITDNAISFHHGKRRYRIGDTIYAQPLHGDSVRGELLLRPVRTLMH